MVGGVEESGWFASNFALAEIRTPFAKQSVADRNQTQNTVLGIPIFEEIIDLVKTEAAKQSRVVGP